MPHTQTCPLPDAGVSAMRATTVSHNVVSIGVQAVEAMRLGNEAAKFVSAAFPRPMELKFERVAQPFMLLHVNRSSLRLYSIVQLFPAVPTDCLLASTVHTGLISTTTYL